MSYIGLGKKKVAAVKDPTGLNPGNFTNVFDVRLLAAKVPFYEIYKVTVKDGFATPTALLWWQNADVWSSVTLLGGAEWAAMQPLQMTPQDEAYFCWNKAFSSAITPPTVTCWLRYDPAINPGIQR